MNPENIFNSKNIKTVIFITFIMITLGLIISLIQTPKYKSSSKLLVIFSQENMSPYTSAQTSNYIAGILEEVIYSDSFMNNVLKSNFNLEDNFGFNQEDRMKNWKKMVKPRLQDNKGIIEINVYHQDREQANNFAQAISYTMITNHSIYHGSGNDVSVKMIGSPTASEKWDQPNILQNLLLSLVAGIFIAITFVIIFPEQELINFIFGKKIVSKDETIIFNNQIQYNNSSEDITSINEEIKSEEKEEYYNW